MGTPVTFLFHFVESIINKKQCFCDLSHLEKSGIFTKFSILSGRGGGGEGGGSIPFTTKI